MLSTFKTSSSNTKILSSQTSTLDMPFSIPVTLTSVKNSADKRHLVVIQGAPTLIGRASKSESKNLQPSPTNALFDCPVISREHAELKASKGPTPSSPDQVTIMDKGSMHGTYVNGKKLERFTPFSLYPNDLVQFGTRVTRGPDTHDGVYVTFDKTTTSNTKKGYSYPSDNEISGDEYSEISDISDDEEDEEAASSAKTTPEQPKSQPGSAQQPIDLTSMPPPSARATFINLVDDARDDGFYPGSYRPQSPILPPRRNLEALKYSLVDDDDDYEPPLAIHKPLPKSGKSKIAELVQDSIDRDAEVLVPESVPLNYLGSTSGGQESVLNIGTALTSILNNVGDNASDRDENEVESEVDAAIENFGEDQIEDDEFDGADHLSESDYSDFDVDDVDLEDLNSYSAKKHVSPELASAIPSKSAPSTQTPFKIGSEWTYGTQVKPATQPYYDPVRASHSGINTYGISVQPAPPKVASATIAQPYKPYTYAAPYLTANGTSLNTFTDMSSSSRWDVTPGNMLYNPTLSSYGPAPSSSRPHHYDCAYPYSYSDLQRPDGLQPYSFGQGWNDISESPALEHFQTPVEGIAKQGLAEAATKKTMKISEMVEKATDAVKAAVDGAEETILAGGKKRKADEMDTYKTVHLSADLSPAESLEREEAVMDNIRNEVVEDMQEPPAQRRKLKHPTTKTAGRNIAGGIAKFATAAAVGGAGTVAFLCSPLAERLIEWLA